MDAAAKVAGLVTDSRRKPVLHDCRHTFASLLIAQSANVVFVSRQLGHASPDITLRVYAHLFDRAEHAERASAALEAGFGAMLEGS
jgi:integrase